MATLMGKKWTDEWLDELNQSIEKGFKQSHGEIRELRAEMNARFDSMWLALLGIAAAIVGSTVAAIVGSAIVT